MVRILFVSLMALGFAAQAQENAKADAGQSTIKAEDTKEKNKVDGNIDEEITNARMRAESGSKSKFSLSSSIGYTGGTLSRPFGVDRPNLAREPGVQERTSADIGLDLRYRWTKSQSLTLGTSAGLMTPFQGDMSASDNQLNVFDPVVGYNLVGKVGEVQMNGGVSVAVGTSQEARGVDRDGSMSLSANALRTFQNGLTVGLGLGLGYNAYNTKPGAISDLETREKVKNFYGGDSRTEWSLGLYPFAEYEFNDTLSARTVFGYFNWRHLYGDSERSRLLQTFVYQSVGVGISVTRDIYLYPNIQFVPGNIRSDFTNVAMSATLNMF